MIFLRMWSGFAMRMVPEAAPPIMSNSAGCSSTRMLPCSMRKPPMTAPNTSKIPTMTNMP